MIYFTFEIIVCFRILYNFIVSSSKAADDHHYLKNYKPHQNCVWQAQKQLYIPGWLSGHDRQVLLLLISNISLLHLVCLNNDCQETEFYHIIIIIVNDSLPNQQNKFSKFWLDLLFWQCLEKFLKVSSYFDQIVTQLFYNQNFFLLKINFLLLKQNF